MKMANTKKLTIGKFHKEYFKEWNKVKRVTPIFEDWYSIDDEEEKGEKHTEIKELIIEFEDGVELIIQPFSNQDDTNEELCNGLRIYEKNYKLLYWKKDNE